MTPTIEEIKKTYHQINQKLKILEFIDSIEAKKHSIKTVSQVGFGRLKVVFHLSKMQSRKTSTTKNFYYNIGNY